MRLAVYNVENLFDRPKAMNLGTWKEGKPILQDFAALSQLLGEVNYTVPRKKRMAELMIRLGLEKDDDAPFVILRRNRGQLLRRPETGGIEIVAEGRADWAGSLELQDEPVDEVAMRNTARVIHDLKADILAVVEAESRPVLEQFNQQILKAVGGQPLRHVMVIDGNDSRGIDVGLMTGKEHPIGLMRSHVDDRDGQGNDIFSRDCPEYAIPLPGGDTLWVLVNHLKSKGYGGKEASDRKRKAQATRVKAIYQAKVAAGDDLIAIVGDFNDTPDSDPLAPLLKQTDLKDVFEHPDFDDGGHPGTYGLCNAGNKIDYILLSPKLYQRVKAGGVMRQGMWPGVKPKRWETYDDLDDPKNAASDHAALWVDLDL
ncbi:MAG: endonuclease/exonuclease/phosphatase family protein [Rubrivivax sp.]|nr:endonuclease/exonuclease/phosphatase family protein [Rubrivivax sp.]